MARPPLPEGAALRALILAKAATSNGYVASDSRHLPNYTQGARTCKRMMRAGLLHPAKVKTHYLHYFTSAAAATNFEDTTQPKTKAQLLAKLRVRYAEKVANGDKPPKPAKVSPPRLSRVKPAKAQQLQVVQRKAPAAPKKDAEIVWPAHIKPVCRMMRQGRYEASVPMVRMGSAEWRAGVGA